MIGIFKTELKKIWHNKMLLITLIGLVFVPILYSGIFLRSVWDPYNNLNNIQVAVVNEDKPATYLNKNINLGDDLVKNLSKDSSFKWDFVDRQKAKAGMESNRYYFSIIIPSDFSKKSTSINSLSPDQLSLEYQTNDSLNFAIKTIGTSVVEKIKNEVSQSLRLAYAKAIISNIKQAGDGMASASDSSNQIYLGIDRLSGGLSKLNNSSINLSEGVTNLTKGSSELNSGINQAVNEAAKYKTNLKEAAEQSKKLADASNKLSDSINKFNNPENLTKINHLKETISQLDFSTPNTLAINDLINKLESLPSDKILELGLSQDDILSAKLLLKQLTDLEKVKASLPPKEETINRIDTLANNIKYLSTGAGAIADGNNKFFEKISTINKQINSPTFTNKINQLNSGSLKLKNGLLTLENSGAPLIDGVGQLNTASNQLKDGSHKLTAALSDGAKKLQDSPLNEKSAQLIAEPIKKQHESYSKVKNYGHGLSPYFMSVSLFVGCMLFNFAYPVRKIYDRKASWLKWFFSKVALGIIMSLLMSIIAGSIMMMLGLEVNNFFGYFGMLIVYTLSIMFMLMFLAVAFDNPGRFVGMVILILSLGSSGGTFPVETASQLYQKAHSLVPMTYSIIGLKGAISGGISALNIKYSYIYLVTLLVTSLILLAITMFTLKKLKGDKAGNSRLDDNQKLLSEDYTNYKL